jgi:hypothetical protein
LHQELELVREQVSDRSNITHEAMLLAQGAGNGESPHVSELAKWDDNQVDPFQ